MGQISRPKLEKLLKKNTVAYKALFKKPDQDWTQQPNHQGVSLRTSEITKIPGRQNKPKRKKAVQKFQKRQDRRNRPRRPKRPRQLFIQRQTDFGTAYVPTSAMFFSNRRDV